LYELIDGKTRRTSVRALSAIDAGLGIAADL
jgi:hypothetical protein